MGLYDLFRYDPKRANKIESKLKNSFVNGLFVATSSVLRGKDVFSYVSIGLSSFEEMPHLLAPTLSRLPPPPPSPLLLLTCDIAWSPHVPTVNLYCTRRSETLVSLTKCYFSALMPVSASGIFIRVADDHRHHRPSRVCFVPRIPFFTFHIVPDCSEELHLQYRLHSVCLCSFFISEPTDYLTVNALFSIPQMPEKERKTKQTWLFHVIRVFALSLARFRSDYSHSASVHAKFGCHSLASETSAPFIAHSSAWRMYRILLTPDKPPV